VASPHSCRGLERRAPNGGRAKWGKRLQIESFLLYQRGDATISEIADTLHVTERTVRAKIGLSKRGQRVHDAGVLFDRGLRVETIAAQLGVSPIVARRYLRERKVKG
jgi:predicted DNA-binding transcriptional regulator